MTVASAWLLMMPTSALFAAVFSKIGKFKIASISLGFLF
jgi:hypothetical protein